MEQDQHSAYFKRHQSRLQSLIAAFRKTAYGAIHCPFVELSNWREFAEIPLLDDAVLTADPMALYVPSGEPEIVFTSSGTRGPKKRIIRPANDTIMPFPEPVDQLLRAERTAFIHSKRSELESFYWLLDKALSEQYGAVPLLYEDQRSAINAAEAGDVLFIYEYPSALYRFLYFLEASIQQGLIQQPHKKAVVLEITGEPVTIEDLRYINAKAVSIFGTEPYLWVTYGMTETGGVGFYDYSPADQEIVYRIAESRVFVETIDPFSGDLCVGSVGEIVVSPYRESGTVLLRYRTGDRGILTFVGGYPCLRQLARPSAVFIAGSQFEISELARAVRREFGFAPKLNPNRQVVAGTGCEILSIEVSVPEWYFDFGHEIASLIRNWVVKAAKLDAEIASGLVSIQVQIVSDEDAPKKGWKVVAEPAHLSRQYP